MVSAASMDSPAAGEDGDVFLCRTSARYFYNSQVATVSFINILTSCMCRRLIINAGIKTVVVRNTREDYVVYDVEDWVREDDILPEDQLHTY